MRRLRAALIACSAVLVYAATCVPGTAVANTAPYDPNVRLSSRCDTTMVVRGDGTLWGWGSNETGVLGRGSTTSSATPAQVLTAASTPLTNVKAVAVGCGHAAALRTDGSVWLVGANAFGELAQGTNAGPNTCGGSACSWYAVRAAASATAALADIKHIAAGDDHVVAVTAGGSLLAWGSNLHGQLGDGASGAGALAAYPVTVQSAASTPLSLVKGAAAGGAFSTAVTVDGSAWAWGQNTSSQTGDGTSVGPVTYAARVRTTASTYLSGIMQVAAGRDSGYALGADGQVWAWGTNQHGQLGVGSVTTGAFAAPSRVSSLEVVKDVIALAAGTDHVSVVRADGSVWGWGRNDSGQLAQGSATGPDTCTVACSWFAVEGRDAGGTRLARAATVAAGSSHSAALKDNGTVVAWGANAAGQLGDGTTTPSLVPVTSAFTPGTAWLAIDGGYEHTIALRADGTVWAWGLNKHGALGIGVRWGGTYPPQQVLASSGVPLTGVRSIAAGGWFNMAVKSDGTLVGWGYNGSNNLGDYTWVDQSYPVTAWAAWGTPLTMVRSVSLGAYQSLAITADGAVWANGGNWGSALGVGPPWLRPDYHFERTRTSSSSYLEGAISVASTDQTSAAVLGDGSVWTWGLNNWGSGDTYSLLGTGSATGPDECNPGTSPWPCSHYAVPARGESTVLTRAIAVAGGTYSYHLSVLRADGEVWTWGPNWDGEHANGLWTGRTWAGPTMYGSSAVGDRMVAVASGYHLTALRADGTVWAAGYGGDGRLGTGDLWSRTWLTQARDTGGALLTNVRTLATGNSFTGTVRGDGTMWMTGANRAGQLSSCSDVNASAFAAVLFTCSGPLPPNAPVDIRSYRADGTTEIPQGGFTTDGRTTNIVLKMYLSAPTANQTLAPWAEIRPIGDAFSATCGANVAGVTFTGPTVSATTIGEGYRASIDVTGLALGEYKWRTCTVDAGGTPSRWEQESGFRRFRVVVEPDAPTSLAQFRSDGTTSIASGALTSDGASTSIILKFSVADGDAGESLTPWVEVRPTGTTFSATCGAAVAGATFTGTTVSAPTGGAAYSAQVDVTGLASGGSYSWRACTVDRDGLPSAWTAMGGAPDFRVDATPPPAVTPLSAPTQTNSLPALTWSTVTDTGGGTTSFYRVYRSPEGCASFAQVSADGAPTAGSWTDSTAVAGTTYCYRVHAVDTVGNEQSTGNATATVEYLGPSAITVAVDNAALDMGPALPGADTTVSSTLTVTTNDVGGYGLTATDTSDTAALLHSEGAATVADWTGPPAAPTNWAAGTTGSGGYFGMTVLSASGGKDTTRWGTGTTSTSFSTLNYAGLQSSTPTLLHQRSTYSATADTVVASYRFAPSTSTRAGGWTSTVTYSATANP